MKAIQCDKCKKYLKECDVLLNGNWSRIEIRNDALNGSRTYRFDLCTVCTNEILKAVGTNASL